MTFQKVGKIIVAGWMSLLILFGGISTALIHEFASHKDGVEPEGKGIVFEKRHHHCAFLGFNLSPFTDATDLPRLHFVVVEHHASYHYLINRIIPSRLFSAFLRGPPQTAC